LTEISNDNINITVPAQEELTSIVRLATTAIANRAGFNLDESDDLNTAIEEIFRYFCSSCKVSGSDISIYFSLYENRLEIRAGETLNSLADNDTKIGRYCRFILDKVTDGYREHSESGRYSLIFEKQSIP
jgi:anti-sigma regulatory factor (Ser/Thr protein kinase)